MSDPRLNSVHLEPPRRQLFRQARDMLLRSRGNQTVFVEQHQEFNRGFGSNIGSNTFIEKEGSEPETGTEFCLLDRDSVFPLKVGINTVGRSSENDVVVSDAFVSRRHCAILVHHSTVCELYDTASKNGTFLNGSKIAGPTQLKTGDEIRMCDKNYIFVSKHDGSSPVALTQTLGE